MWFDIEEKISSDTCGGVVVATAAAAVWDGRRYNGGDIKKEKRKKKKETSFTTELLLIRRKFKGTFTFTRSLSNYRRTYIQFISLVAARKFRWFRGNKHTNVVFKVESHTDDDKDDEDEDDEKKEEEEDEDLRSLLVSSMEYNDDTCKEMDGWMDGWIDR
ncbi:hypothetical protein HZH68_011669 [Vespula germanica]|uniref:Uncharacterized protein n=1 Tax=Vespula germanica TaxID=30212 RepID=A0A834JKR8_VESGE|nr:hypothetical protein HZH68_011669 [Vespula germanica]